MHRHTIAYGLLAALFIIGFQNCGSSGGDLSLEGKTNGPFAMQEIAARQISAVQYRHEGGLAGPGVLPQKTLGFVAGYNGSSGTAHVHVELNGMTKDCSVALSASEIGALYDAMLTSFVGYDHTSASVADYGDAYVTLYSGDIILKTYKFYGGDTSHTGPVLFGNTLHALFDSYLASITCNL